MANNRWRAPGMLIAVGLALVLVGCGGTVTTEEPYQPEVMPTSEPVGLDPAADKVNLDGTEWVLSSLHGQEVLTGTNITLEFTTGNASGFAGCNGYGGPYVVDGGNLEVQELAVTAQGCIEPPGVMEQESAYTQTLLDGVTYQMADDYLEIKNAAGKMTLRFTRKERYAIDPDDLVGTAWRLVSTSGKLPVEGTTITLVFGDESHASGHAGCRDYAVTYEASEDRIRFPFVSMTGEDGCLAQESLYKQEGQFTDALTWATQYRLGEDRFEVMTARGEVLAFEPMGAEPAPGLEETGAGFPPTDYACDAPTHMAWNSHKLEELSEQVQEALVAAGIDGAEGYATAYGEDWYEGDENTGGNQTLCNFSIMETDFYIQVPAADLTDFDALGATLSEVLVALDRFSTEETPGSQAGIIDIRFTSGDEEARVHLTVTEAADARARGLEGARLLDALRFSGLPCYGYLDLLVFYDGAQEQAVVTSYRCPDAHVDSTGQSPASSPSFSIPAGEPLSLYMATRQSPDSVEARLYPEPGLAASFFRWPEELPLETAPLEHYQLGPTASFQIVPQVPPGEYSLVVQAVWEGDIEVFYAFSLALE